jgi:hypothetical protein
MEQSDCGLLVGDQEQKLRLAKGLLQKEMEYADFVMADRNSNPGDHHSPFALALIGGDDGNHISTRSTPGVG